MNAKDIMTKDVVSIGVKTKVVDIAKLLLKKGIHGVPVIDKEKKILGIITMSDFFIKGYPEIYLPSYINFLKKTKFHKNVKLKQKASSNTLLKAKATDIMTENCFCIPEDTEVKDILNRYSSSSLKTIPIINKELQLVGIITRSDIVKLIKL